MMDSIDFHPAKFYSLLKSLHLLCKTLFSYKQQKILLFKRKDKNFQVKKRVMLKFKYTHLFFLFNNKIGVERGRKMYLTTH